jgi:NADH dehydrogenase FAD-containing subunit
MSDKPLIILKLAGYFLTSAIYLLKFFVSSRINRLTYKLGDNPKNVVVVGASFAGFHLAKQLAESIPSGYRVILIERHSHFFFTWNFPRSTVVPGHDHKAFVPYLDRLPSTPEGAYTFKRGTVVSIDSKKVVLEDGSEIEYEYLAVATGSHARYPSKLQATEKPECVEYFQDQQERIKQAQRVIVVGGGAAGMEVASDTKSKYPGKDVTLIHSRDRLLNNFGPLLHTKAMEALDALGVKTYLNERATTGVDEEYPKEVTLKSGVVLHCDTLVSLLIHSFPHFSNPPTRFDAPVSIRVEI